MAETYHVVPENLHNALVEAAYQHRGFTAGESAAAARFATCSSIIRISFLYGSQNAWRRLIGLETSFVIVAS